MLKNSPKNASKKLTVDQVENYATSVIAPSVKGGEIFALIGPLGSGKTTFTKALGKALGVKNRITSPTFVVMQQSFSTKPKLHFYHLDLYRTKDFKEIESLGITEWWGHPETITIIEWADKILDKLPKNTQYIYLSRND